jgi:outer membrane receptor protein involved in Fe transport
MVRYLSNMLATGQLQANGLPGGPDRNLSPYTQLDLTLGYGADFDESRFLEEWRLQLAITNITDEYPDFFAPGDQASAWDLKYGLPFGTTYSLQLTAMF